MNERINEIRERHWRGVSAFNVGYVSSDIGYLLAEVDKYKALAENGQSAIDTNRQLLKEIGRLRCAIEDMTDVAKSCEDCEIAKRDFDLSHNMEYLDRVILREKIVSLQAELDVIREAERDGLCVTLPCKPGSPVYRVSTDGAGIVDDEDIDEDVIDAFYVDAEGLGISVGPYEGFIGHYTHEGCDNGVWKIFLDRDKAEASIEDYIREMDQNET